MTHYKLYFLENMPCQILRIEDLDARDDAQALAKAKAFKGQYPLELWQDTRPVGRIETPTTALLARYRVHKARGKSAAA